MGKRYQPEDLEQALRDVKAGKMTQPMAARVYGIPQSTIGTRIANWKRQQNLK